MTDTTGPTAAPSDAQGWLRFFVDHLGLMAAAVGLLTVIIKLVAVSHGDPVTIGAIIKAQGSADIVVASIVAGAANLFFIAIVFVVPNWGEAVRERDPLTVPTVNLVIGLSIVAVLAPARYLPLVALYLAYFAVTSSIWAWRDRRRGRPRSAIRRAGARSYLITLGMGAVLMWVAIAASARMWLPPERFQLRGGDELVGYALAEDSQSVTVLAERDRSVRRVASASVSERSYCRLGDDDPRTLLNLALGHDEPEYQSCSKSDD